MKAKLKKNFHRAKYTGYQWISLPRSSVRAEPKTKYFLNIKNLFSCRFKLRTPHNIGGGTHFSGGRNPNICPTTQAVKICPIIMSMATFYSCHVKSITKESFM